MNDAPPWMDGPPRRLLLSTDLSARCDRAFDRAVQLAAEWQAELIALKVLENPQAPDQLLAWSGGDDQEWIRTATRKLERDLDGVGIRAGMRLARGGDVAQTVRETAEDSGSGLIVTGMARNETLGRFLLGSTVERLARTVPQPLLVVRERVHGPYRRIVVATDFSASSAHALQATVRLFPGREYVLYHAYQTPLAGLPGKDVYGGTARAIEQGECAAFLANVDLPAPARARLRTVIEHGSLATVLTRYVREHDIELVAMGTHGRSGLMNVMLGSTAARLLDWLPCDTLMVRKPREA